jgi:hypothetical protein
MKYKHILEYFPLLFIILLYGADHEVHSHFISMYLYIIIMSISLMFFALLFFHTKISRFLLFAILCVFWTLCVFVKQKYTRVDLS